MSRVYIAAHVDSDLAERLDGFAARFHARCRSSAIRTLLASALDAHEAAERPVLLAKAKAALRAFNARERMRETG